MEPKVFRQLPFVHVLVTGLFLWFFWMLWKVLSTPVSSYVNGGLPAKVGLTIALVALIVLLAILYLTTSFNRYVVDERGLTVERFGRAKTYAWSEFVRISWWPRLKTIRVFTRKGLPFYSSTDLFPGWPELIVLIHDRSHCVLSANLARALAKRAEILKQSSADAS